MAISPLESETEDKMTYENNLAWWNTNCRIARK